MNESRMSRTTGRGIIHLALAGLMLAAGPVQALAIDLFFDDMESGVNGWTLYRETEGLPLFCTANEWEQSTLDSHSATTCWTNSPYQEAGGDDPTSVCINYLESPAFAMPNGIQAVTLSFWHHFNTEDTFDLAEVQVSTDDTNWTTVYGPNSGISQPGNGLSYNQVTEPLVEGEYIPGQNLAVRFRFSSDQLVPGIGWFIDDVKVSGEQIVPVQEVNFGTIKAIYRNED